MMPERRDLVVHPVGQQAVDDLVERPVAAHADDDVDAAPHRPAGQGGGVAAVGRLGDLEVGLAGERVHQHVVGARARRRCPRVGDDERAHGRRLRDCLNWPRDRGPRRARAPADPRAAGRRNRCRRGARAARGGRRARREDGHRAPGSVGRALVGAALAVFGAVVLALCARGLMLLRYAARTPVIVLQLLALPVGYSLAFQAGRVGYGGPVLSRRSRCCTCCSPRPRGRRSTAI